MHQVLDVPTTSGTLTLDVDGRPTPVLTYDPEWLAITRAFHPLLSTTKRQPPFPAEEEARERVRQAQEWITTNVYGGNSGTTKRIEEVQTFAMTAPGPTDDDKRTRTMQRTFCLAIFRTSRCANRAYLAPWYTNSQTVAFCDMIGVENKINPPPPNHGKLSGSKS